MTADFNHWQALFENIDRNTQALVKKTAGNIKVDAQDRAPRETGFMADSIYVITEEGAESQTAAPTRPDQQLFPEIEATPHNEAIVAVGASYGIFPELGTSKMAAHPYLIPAAEDQVMPFVMALLNLETLTQ